MSFKKGFTLIELLIVVAIIGTLSTTITASVGKARNRAYLAKATREFHAFQDSMLLYLIDHNVYPADVNRNVPAGMEQYLTGGSWPDGPWPGSVYDWDNIIGADPYIQISLRFCDINGNHCHFPDEEWAEDFDAQSAMFLCFEGACRSHSSRPVDHPGYCLNCE